MIYYVTALVAFAVFSLDMGILVDAMPNEKAFCPE